MISPEEALAQARARAADQVAPDDASEDEGRGRGENPRGVALRRLARWAMIEPDEAEVYSTRRGGAPITALKRVLIRLMRQYLVQMSAQQSRFNAHLVGELVELEDRVRALEAAAHDTTGARATAGDDPSGADQSPGDQEPGGR